MIRGSFEGLYTFKQASEIYNLKESFLRKQVFLERLIVGRDIMKFGNTWVITEQAVIKYFGVEGIRNYRGLSVGKEAMAPVKKKVKSKRKAKAKSVESINFEKEEKVSDSWTSDIKGKEIKNFSF